MCAKDLHKIQSIQRFVSGDACGGGVIRVVVVMPCDEFLEYFLSKLGWGSVAVSARHIDSCIVTSSYIHACTLFSRKV